MGAVTYPTLEHVAMEARPYPSHLIEGCETGLCLFSAAFQGHNDSVHFAMAGIQTTCVDVDDQRLMEMRLLYPEAWRFVHSDAWKFADIAYAEEMTYDAVSVDTFTGDVMRRSLDSLELWCSLARKVVTVTITSEAFVNHEWSVPAGWKSSLHKRAETVHWLVLTRD